MNNATHRSSDALLTDQLKFRLTLARKAADEAMARGDVSPGARWPLFGNEALMSGRDYASTALYEAAKSFFESRRVK